MSGLKKIKFFVKHLFPSKESFFVKKIGISYYDENFFVSFLPLPKIFYLGFQKPKKFEPKRFSEDSYSFSFKYPIFAVADGIAIRGNGNKKFPKISPARKAADIFIINSIKLLEKEYENLEENIIFDIFKKTNEKIKFFNNKLLRNKKINYWDIDYAHISASCVAIKNNFLYYGNIGENFIFIFRNGKKIFATKPIGWHHRKEFNPDFENIEPFFIKASRDRIEEIKNLGEKLKPQDFERLGRKYFRNKVAKIKVNKKFKILPYGYGVLTGENNALYFLEYGKLELKKNDIIVIGSDGALPYFESKAFKEFTKNWNYRKFLEFIKEERKKDPKEAKEATYFIIRMIKL